MATMVANFQILLMLLLRNYWMYFCDLNLQQGLSSCNQQQIYQVWWRLDAKPGLYLAQTNVECSDLDVK